MTHKRKIKNKYQTMHQKTYTLERCHTHWSVFRTHANGGQEIPFQRFGGNSGVSSEFVADATEDSFWRKPPKIGLVTRFQCVALHSTNCGRAWNDFFPDGKKKEKLQPGPTQPHAIDEVIVAPCESLQPRQRRHEYPLRRGVTEKKRRP
jgi:hypothetical protein